MNENELPEDDEIIIISKSQQKRESEALQALGEELVKLPPNKLAKFPLPEKLEAAIKEAQRISARGGHKRQLQYIGKIMRQIDAEPIQRAMDELKKEHLHENARLHQLEQWRDRLIADGDAALAELLENQPNLDRQHLRQLMRNAQQEAKQNKPPKSARELFRYLREAME